MLGLGHLYNVLGTGDGAYVSLIDASGVDFIGILSGGDTYTVTEAVDAAGTSAAVLTKITSWYSTKVDGTAVWAKNTLAANSAITASATTQGVAVIHIEATQLSDGFKYVKCASTSTGLVIPLVFPLRGRTPANHPALGA